MDSLKEMWGKFTLKGSETVEKSITQMLEKIADKTSETLEDGDYISLELIGGYGRGEGGVLINKQKDEKPHNNFDLILISKANSPRIDEEIQDKLNPLYQHLSKEFGIGIDLSVINGKKLSSLASLIIFYDMRFGHKTLLGDPEYLADMTQFRVDRIPDWDARNLLVNRGTLLIINDLIFEQKKLTKKFKKLILKHLVKAIIGYGDTLLFFLGDYDWSYAEKQKRMQKRNDVPEKFKNLYDEAMNFRFLPDYEKYMKKNLKTWILQLRPMLSEVHLKCESIRLGIDDLEWGDYPFRAFEHALFEDFDRPREIAKKAVNFMKAPSYPGGGTFKSFLGFRALGPKGILPILFPQIVYLLNEDKFRSFVKKFIGAESKSDSELRKKYLLAWSTYGDVNFINVQNKYDLNLD